MRKLIIIVTILILSGLLPATEALAQDSLFSQCGLLFEGEECLLFSPIGSQTHYTLEYYAGFGPGDSIFVAGIIDIDTVCLEADYYILIDTISICNEDPYQYFSGPGILIQTSDCLLFNPLNLPAEYYALDEYGAFGEGDTVQVEGYIFQNCQSSCSEATGCIINNSISLPPPPPAYPYESFGILFQSIDCVLFAPNNDSVAAIELDNLAEFQPGDSVFVSGDLIYECQSPCSQAIACLVNTIIDSFNMPSNPISGSAVVQLGQASYIGDVFQMSEITVIDSIYPQNIYLVNFADSVSRDSIIVSLYGHTSVVFAEPNFEVDFPENLQLSISFPDEYAPQLDVDLGQPMSYFSQNCLQVIDSDSANQISTGGGTVVAVIDNGIDMDHPLMQTISFVEGYDYYDNDTDPAPDSGLGASHGTFVTGIINLISPESQIMPLRALGESGKGNTFAIAKALYFAHENGADIINMSFGTYTDSYLLNTACQSVLDAGIILAAAGGNDSSDVPIYPASYEGVIAVAAVDSLDFLAEFSNYGSSLDICAPGVDIYSTLVGDYDWGTWTGTSFSAPQVTAACALIHAVRPLFTPAEVETHLRLTAETELGPGLIVPPDLYYGYGRLDIAKAVWSLASQTPENGCGDVNLDDAVNVSDAVYIINYIFVPDSPPPGNMAWADVNSDSYVNVSDVVYLLNYIYVGGPAPNCPVY